MKREKFPIILVILIFLSGCNLPLPGPTPVVIPTSLPMGGMADTPNPPQNTPTTLPTLTITVPPTPTATRNPTAIPLIPPGMEIELSYLDMIDAHSGWGIGGPAGGGRFNHIFRTEDGGTTWMDVTPPDTLAPESVANDSSAVGFFMDASTGWITFHGVSPSQVPSAPLVWRTINGGLTWESSAPLDTSGNLEVYSVSDLFFSGSTGWILAHVGGGMNHDYVVLYRSIDGGRNWVRLLDPSNDGGIQSCWKTGLYFSDASNGWLSGNCFGVAPGALLFRSSDGGSSWTRVELPAPAGYPDLFASSDFACGVRAPYGFGNTVFFGVECVDQTGSDVNFLYSIPKQGANWSYLSYPGGDFRTADGATGWALGRDIYETGNGGESWTKISSVDWDGQFDFVSPLLGWGVGLNGSEYSLWQTFDGGATWTAVVPRTG